MHVQEKLIGDCLVTSSFLSYTGSFTFEYRKEMVYGMWLTDVVERNLPISPGFRVEDLLTDEVEVTLWASDGLPSDELSVQNGILTMHSSRFPLCIDPQMQAVSWIKKKCGKELEGRVKTFNDPDFLKQLELAIQYGFPFLFENLDEYIDPVIDSVLEKNIQGAARKIVRLGDKEIEWDDHFRLYMTSKLANPHYTPEVAGKTMIINYGVTLQGLSEQLLNVTVRHERPDLEEQREQLVIEMSKDKAELAKLEDTLLYELSNASGTVQCALGTMYRRETYTVCNPAVQATFWTIMTLYQLWNKLKLQLLTFLRSFNKQSSLRKKLMTFAPSTPQLPSVELSCSSY